ncbi:MAG: hypothetical protein OEZ13_03030 [Spirochaetia bacterium]|nr:hypothetical protein [Spirochaetia bacterium]
MKRYLCFSLLFLFVFTVHASDAYDKEKILKKTKKYIEYYKTIKLTSKQEQIRKEALEAFPAPCCKDYSMATCCCPCNMAKSVWGLSKYLITKKGYNARQVRKAAQQWIKDLNPDGFSGTSCKSGRCDLPFNKDGCGGMKEHKLK